MIRRVSLGVALALAALTTAACSNPTAPTAQKVVKVRGDATSPNDTLQLTRIGVQGSSI